MDDHVALHGDRGAVGALRVSVDHDVVHRHLRLLLELLEAHLWLVHWIKTLVLEIGHQRRRRLLVVLFKRRSLHVTVVKLGWELRIHELTLAWVHIDWRHHHLHVVLLLRGKMILGLVSLSRTIEVLLIHTSGGHLLHVVHLLLLML